eukprot:7370612-Prymnesium_polylepis.1
MRFTPGRFTPPPETLPGTNQQRLSSDKPKVLGALRSPARDQGSLSILELRSRPAHITQHLVRSPVRGEAAAREAQRPQRRMPLDSRIRSESRSDEIAM